MSRPIGPSPTRALILLAALAAAWWYLRAQVRREAALDEARSPTVAVAFAAAPRDLAADEAAGGHTLSRHVGLSDADLARRLAEEPSLAAASTFADRATAERAVGAALDAGRPRLRDWLARPGETNLALAWAGDGAPLGRVLERGAAAPAPARAARVVVRRRDGSWFVLTAYPFSRGARPMTPPPTERDFDAELSPESLPRLGLFLAGYLHEDLAPEHGSAARAAFEYAAEAELDELEELARDWEVLRAAARALPLARVNALLRARFGSAWQATTAEEFEAVAREFERALRE